MDVNVNPNGNPSITTFAIQCADTDPYDAAWEGKYVNATGQPNSSAVWQTDSSWGTTTVQGLNGCTQYTFAVKARNQAMEETDFGAAASASTVLVGDLDTDGGRRYLRPVDSARQLRDRQRPMSKAIWMVTATSTSLTCRPCSACTGARAKARSVIL